RIAACGAVDEFNAWLGLCRTLGPSDDVDVVLARLQHEMFALGAELGSPDPQKYATDLLRSSHVGQLECDIDRFEVALPPLTNFILPGGCPLAAALHTARCVCRRAEREVVTLSRAANVRQTALEYLNRTSDLMFVLARACNASAGVPDI